MRLKLRRKVMVPETIMMITNTLIMVMMMGKMLRMIILCHSSLLSSHAHNNVCPVNVLLNKSSCLSRCCRRHELGKVMKISYPFFHQEKGRLTCAKCTKEK